MSSFQPHPGSIPVADGNAFHLEGQTGIVYSRAVALAFPGGGLFLGFETRPASSVLPLVADKDGNYTGGWFLRAQREVEGVTLKATGNYNNPDETPEASAIRSLRVKMGIEAAVPDLIPVYQDCGIGRQFVFNVHGFVVTNFQVDDTAPLPPGHERVFLTISDMVRLTREWNLFGDDTYRLILWVLMHNHYPSPS